MRLCMLQSCWQGNSLGKVWQKRTLDEIKVEGKRMIQHMHGCLQRVVLVNFFFVGSLFSLAGEDTIMNVAAPWMFCSMVMVPCIVTKQRKEISANEQESSGLCCGVCSCAAHMPCCCVCMPSTPKIFAMQHVHMRPTYPVPMAACFLGQKSLRSCTTHTPCSYICMLSTSKSMHHRQLRTCVANNLAV
jgi:hypothetical protein